MKTKIKKRVTRFQPSITKRKAEVYFEGRSLDLNDARIKRALDYNEDLSNQFVVGTPSRYSSYPGGAEHSYQPEKRVKKPRKAQQKREKPMAEEGVAQIKDLQRVFGEVEDFELMKEVVPKEQYVLKERPNKRRQHTTTLKINNYDSFFDDTEPIDSDSPLAVVAEEKQKTPGKLFKCDGDTLKMALSATSSFQPQNENEQGKQQQQSSSSHVDDTFDSQSLLATVAEEPTSSGGRVLKSHGSLNTAKNLSACPFRASTAGWELREEEEEQWEESLNTAKSLSATSSFRPQPENEQGKQQQQSSSSHVVDSSDYQSLLATVAEEPTSAGGRVLKSHGNLNTAKSLSISACPLRASTAGWELREEEEEQWEESLNTAKSLSATSSFRPQNENEQSKQHQQSSSTQAVDSFDYQSLLATVAEEPTSSDGRVLKSHGSLNTAKSLSTCLYRASAGWEIREEEEEQWEEKPAESPEYEYLKVLLDKCDEKRAINWEQFTMSFDNCVKLGEGTYGEVFKFCVGNEEAAIKIIPISATPQDCDRLVNGSSLQSPGIVSNELNITRKLSDLADETETCRLGFVTPTFIRLIRAAVVKGEYPKQLLDAWDDFKEEKSELCENQRPSEYATADQHFMLLALSNGGVDLEAYWIREPRESYSIFYQIALALAIAEDALEFEHRDLHIGNVLIDDQCNQDETIGYVYNNESIQINSCGVKVSIIDFTNSRMTINGGTFFMNLSEDECLFTGKGLPKGDYQFDIYRMMREENGNVWNTFTPKTNLLWLHYLSRKLFGIPRLFKKKVREPLLKMFDALLEHNRVKDFLESQPFEREFKEYKVQQRKQSESEEESLLEH